MKVRLMNYPGCKIKYTEQINEKIRKAQEVDVFVEPFCGTASVTLNLDREFKRVVINDMSRDVMRIIKSFRDCEYRDIWGMYDDIAREFGNIKTDKSAYYNFRNAYNSLHYGKNTIVEGLFLYVASRAAINSLFRVGPSGFNQSFGARSNTISITEEEFDEVKKRLSDCVFFNTDYRDVVCLYDDVNVLFFFDPPYVDRKVQGSYKDENKFDQDVFLETLNNLKGKTIYTDVYSEELLSKLGAGWKCEVFVDKKNVSPGRNKEDKIDYR